MIFPFFLRQNNFNSLNPFLYFKFWVFFENLKTIFFKFHYILSVHSTLFYPCKVAFLAWLVIGVFSFPCQWHNKLRGVCCIIVIMLIVKHRALASGWLIHLPWLSLLTHVMKKMFYWWEGEKKFTGIIFYLLLQDDKILLNEGCVELQLKFVLLLFFPSSGYVLKVSFYLFFSRISFTFLLMTTPI